MWCFVSLFFNWLPGKARLWNDLLCVESDVKPYAVTHSFIMGVDCSVIYGRYFCLSLVFRVYAVFCFVVCGCQYQCSQLPGMTRLWNDLLYCRVGYYTLLTHSLLYWGVDCSVNRGRFSVRLLCLGCMLCCVWLFLVVSISGIDCLEWLVSEMTCYVSSETLNPTYSLTPLSGCRLFCYLWQVFLFCV